jgi:Zn-dependent peptidase ImmA (M78 family)
METKFDFEKVREMVIEKQNMKSICKYFKISEVVFYRSITDQQRDELKSIRNKYVHNLSPRVIYKRFLEGSSVSDLAHEYRVSSSTINLTIDRGLDIYRQESKVNYEKEYIEAINPIEHYRNELLNFMLSPEGTSLPQDKLLRMIVEVKDLNEYLKLQ